MTIHEGLMKIICHPCSPLKTPFEKFAILPFLAKTFPVIHYPCIFKESTFVILAWSLKILIHVCDPLIVHIFLFNQRLYSFDDPQKYGWSFNYK